MSNTPPPGVVPVAGITNPAWSNFGRDAWGYGPGGYDALPNGIAGGGGGGGEVTLSVNLPAGTYVVKHRQGGWRKGGGNWWWGQFVLALGGFAGSDSPNFIQIGGAAVANPSEFSASAPVTIINHPGGVIEGWCWNNSGAPSGPDPGVASNGIPGGGAGFPCGQECKYWGVGGDGSPCGTWNDWGCPPWFDIYVYDEFFPPEITSPGTGIGKVGSLFSYQIVAPTAERYELQSAPVWVKISPSGLVRAIPPAVGNFSWVLRAGRGVGWGSKLFTLTVSPPDNPVDQTPLFELPLMSFDGSIYIDPITGEPLPSGEIPLSEEFMYREVVDGNGAPHNPQLYQPYPFNVEAKSYFSPSPEIQYNNTNLVASRFVKNNHGLLNGASIVFTRLTQTAGSTNDLIVNPAFGGINKNYRYYVVQANENSFGISPLNPAVFSGVPAVEITASYANINFRVWGDGGNVLSESIFWSEPTLLYSVGVSLPWSYQSSNTQYAGITSVSDNVISVSYPSPTGFLGAIPVSTVKPKQVQIDAVQAGSSVYKPARAYLIWGDNLDDGYDPTDLHTLTFTIPSEIGLGQEVSFSVADNKNLAPIFVRSRNTNIVQITGLSPGGPPADLGGAGWFTYAGSAKILGVSYGNALIEAAQDGNPNVRPNIGSAYAVEVVTVAKKSQVITFDVPAIPWEEGMEIELSATASSGLPVTLFSTNSNVAFFKGNILSILGQGSTTLIASQSGDNEWAPASKQIQIGVGSSSQFISFGNFGEVRYGDSPFRIRAFALSGLPITFVSSDISVASVSTDGTVSINGVGSVTITAKQAGDAYWKPAPDVSRLLTVLKGIPVITAQVPSSISLNRSPREYEIFGGSSHGVQVTFNVSVGSIAFLRIDEVEENPPFSRRFFLVGLSEGVGTVVVSAGATALYEAVSARFQVKIGRQSQNIFGSVFELRKFSDAYIDLRLQTSSNLPVSLQVISGPGQIAFGTRISFTGVGVILVRASQVGNSDFRSAPDFDIVIVVEKGVQTISFMPLSPFSIGDTRQLFATSSGGSPVSFYSSSPSVVSVSEGIATGVTLGTVFVLAITPGNENYEPAAAVQPLSVVALIEEAVNVQLPLTGDSEIFSSVQPSSASSLACKIVNILPLSDHEPYGGYVSSLPNLLPGKFIDSEIKDEESFDPKFPSSTYQGVCFVLSDYPGRGDVDVAYLSQVPSVDFSGDCHVFPSLPVNDVTDCDSTSPSELAAENCTAARHSGKDFFEPYCASPSLQPNGFILLLTGDSTPCVSNWTDWLPPTESICEGQQFIQTQVDLNGCQNVRERIAVGNKAEPCPEGCVTEWANWLPSASTICKDVVFTQTRIDLRGCQPPQTRLANGLKICQTSYTFIIEVVSISEVAGKVENPPCPRVNSWAVGSGASSFITARGIYTHTYPNLGAAGVDIFTWKDLQYVLWYSAAEYNNLGSGQPEIIAELAGENLDQEKLQIKYTSPGTYKIRAAIYAPPYIGFGSSTGAASDEHWIHDFHFEGSGGDSITFSDLKTDSAFIGVAQVIGNSIRLTPNQGGSSGNVFYRQPVKLFNLSGTPLNWSVFFEFSIGGGSAADGISFILQSNSLTAGGTGGGIGYQGIPKSVAVSYDQWYFNPCDPNFEHIEINAGGSACSLITSGSLPFGLRGSTGTNARRFTWIDYIGGVFYVYYNNGNLKPAAPTLTYTLNIADYIL